MESHVVFFIFWLVNSIVIGVLGLLMPNSIVLGTYRLSLIESAIHAGFWLTFFVWTMKDYLSVRKVEFIPPSLRFWTFLFINSFGVWVVSRLSGYTGLGIVNYGLAFLIGGTANILQESVWKKVRNKLKD